MESFFETFGTEFWNKDGSLGKWQKTVAKVAEEEFDSLLEHYPLSGDLVRRQQLARLLGELKEFMDYIWRHDASQFVAAERAFGFEEDVELAAGEGSLYVRGYIDLIRTTGKMTQIWDFNTRIHPACNHSEKNILNTAYQSQFRVRRQRFIGLRNNKINGHYTLTSKVNRILNRFNPTPLRRTAQNTLHNFMDSGASQ